MGVFVATSDIFPIAPKSLTPPEVHVCSLSVSRCDHSPKGAGTKFQDDRHRVDDPEYPDVHDVNEDRASLAKLIQKEIRIYDQLVRLYDQGKQVYKKERSGLIKFEEHLSSIVSADALIPLMSEDPEPFL